MTEPAQGQMPKHVEETTRNQVAAADPQVSAWVSANAGSGKTRVLTNRVIRLLLSDVDPSRILCLTFTKAAAAEMANRLFKQLGEWATHSDKKLIEEIEKLEGEVVSRERLTRARRLFARAIETPGGLKIQTIHAFAQTVLGRFPLESGVTPHFEVIEERTRAELLSDARWHVIEEAQNGRNPLLTEAMHELTEMLDDRGLDELLSEVVGHAAKLIEVGPWQLAIDRLSHELGVAGDDEEELLAESIETILSKSKDLQTVIAALLGGGATDQKRAEKLKAAFERGLEDAAYETYVSAYLTQKGTPQVTLATKDVQAKCPMAEEVLRTEQERIVELEQKRKAFQLISATKALLIFAEEFLQTYATEKAQRGVLDYDDLISKTRELLRGGEASAWVHYKLDGGIDHILVDEAQDTSPDQWQIIRDLASEFFAGKSSFDERVSSLARTVFAVGDEKQSIYSFQGAEPFRFSQNREWFCSRVEASGQTFSDLDLKTSFRSVPEILSVVDQSFSSKDHASGLTSSQSPVAHAAARCDEQGLVEIWSSIPAEKKEETSAWDKPLDRISQKSPRALLAARIADQIESWLEAKELLRNNERAIRPGDILILVQRRNAFVDEMVRALKSKNIPVAGRDRMVLTSQLSVMDLLSLAEFALLPEDDLNLAVVLKSPFVGLSEEELFNLAHGREGGLWQALGASADAHAGLAKAREILMSVLARAERYGPFDFFKQALISRTPVGNRAHEALLHAIGPEAGDAIDEFLNLCLAYERNHGRSLQGFVLWMSEEASDIKREFEQEVDEVRIMTVHGAKGLEAPIVFLPDTCTVPSSRQDDQLLFLGEDDEVRTLVWRQGTAVTQADLVTHQRQQVAAARMEEHRRLLYVAMTRAMDRLYICGYETQHGRKEGCWYNIVEEMIVPMAEEVADKDGEIVWRIGHLPKGTATGSPAEAKASVTLPDWAQRPAPQEVAQKRTAPSRLGASEAQESDPPVLSPLKGQNDNRFKRGLLIHTLLEHLPQMPLEQRQDAMTAYLKEAVHGLSKSVSSEIEQEVGKVLADPVFAEIFGPDSLAEVPLMGRIPGTQIQIRGQIDRLLITSDRVLIIDYKTNRPPPMREEDVANVYVSQMAAYRAVLGELYPGQTIECGLLWTDSPRLMRLSEARLDEAAARFSSPNV